MKWDLFFSDVLARLLGLLGLFACGFWCLAAARRITDAGSLTPGVFSSGMLLLCLAFTLIFILPGLHDRFMRMTLPFLARLVFLPFALAGCGAVALGLMALLAVSPLQQEIYAFSVTVLVIGTGVLFSILVFPFGLAYREPKRQLEALQRQAPDAFHDRRPYASARPANPETLRKADIWDFVVGAPLGLTLIAAFYGFKLSTVAQTAAYDQWVDDHWLIGLAATFAVLWVPLLAILVFRGEVHNPRAPRNKALRRGLFLISMPLFVFITFVGAAYDGIPAVWNLVQDHEPATIRYEVTDVYSSRRLSGCMTLQVVAQVDRQMLVCNMPQNLREGDVIDATGPLSTVGHTIEQVRLVP